MNRIRLHQGLHLATIVLLIGPMSLSLVIPVAAKPEVSPVDVFLLAGQSNMAGRAPGSEAGAMGDEVRIRMDYVCSFSAQADGNGPPEPHRSDGWVPLRLSPKHASTPGSHFGPEIGLGRGLVERQPDRETVFIKNGRGGSSLAVDWAVENGPFYRDFVEQSRRALGRLDAEGKAYRLAAFVWCQGEADATQREWADAYGENLTALIAGIRAEFDRPDLPVIIVLTGDGRLNPLMIAPDEVRRVQRAVAESVGGVRLVEADDLGLMDKVHYDAAAQVEIGRRVAEAWFDWEEDVEP